MTHTHDYTISKIDKKPSKFGKYGYLYQKCECNTVLGTPIKSKKQLKAIEQQINDQVASMGEGLW